MTRTTQAYTRSAKPKAAPPPQNRLVRLLSEARWIICAVLTAYLVIIFMSYSKADPGWSQASAVQHLQNWGGRIGAWLADLMLFVFGASVAGLSIPIAGRLAYLGSRALTGAAAAGASAGGAASRGGWPPTANVSCEPM